MRPDGKISLPLLNDIPAAGLTPSELRDLLAKRLAEYMPAPAVAVIVTEVRSFKVSVLGEVSRPGRFELAGTSDVAREPTTERRVESRCTVAQAKQTKHALPL